MPLLQLPTEIVGEQSCSDSTYVEFIFKETILKPLLLPENWVMFDN